MSVYSMEKDNSIYRWTKYYLNIQNTLISGNCTSCGNLIENEANVVNGQHYHPSCFTCDKCKNPLGAEKYFILKGGSYCKNCKDVSLYVHVVGGILKKCVILILSRNDMFQWFKND